MQFSEYLHRAGLKPNSHVLVHSGFRAIKSAFQDLTIESVISILQNIITTNGSLIMPAFTYCFIKSKGEIEIFDRSESESKVGAMSEVFRKSRNVIRTSSPTHSFSMWGKIANELNKNNNPQSPLGKGSVLDWLSKTENSFLLLLGVDFTAMSFCHYLEVKASIPWNDFSPWNHLHVEKIGISTDGEIELHQIPGCSKSFINFEKYLNENKFIKPYAFNNFKSYCIPVELIIEHGLNYFKDNPESLLCEMGTCAACDSRWEYYLNNLKDEASEIAN